MSLKWNSYSLIFFRISIVLNFQYSNIKINIKYFLKVYLAYELYLVKTSKGATRRMSDF